MRWVGTRGSRIFLSYHTYPLKTPLYWFCFMCCSLTAAPPASSHINIAIVRGRTRTQAIRVWPGPSADGLGPRITPNTIDYIFNHTYPLSLYIFTVLLYCRSILHRSATTVARHKPPPNNNHHRSTPAATPRQQTCQQRPRAYRSIVWKRTLMRREVKQTSPNA